MDALARAASETFWSLLRASWQASVLILLLALLLWICGRKMSPAWRYGLWLLVLVRLVLPWSVESPSSLFNWLHVAEPSQLPSAPLRNVQQPMFSKGATAREAGVPSLSPQPGATGPGSSVTAPIYLPLGARTVRVQTKGGQIILSPVE